MLFEVRGVRISDGKRVKATVRAADLTAAIHKAADLGVRVVTASEKPEPEVNALPVAHEAPETSPAPDSADAEVIAATSGEAGDANPGKWWASRLGVLVAIASLLLLVVAARAWLTDSENPNEVGAAARDVENTVADGAAHVNPEPAAVTSTGPIDIVPAPEVDETLFLIRVLENSYDSWPDDLDSQYAVGWAIDQRLSLERIRTHAQRAGLDESAVDAIEETLGVFSQYDEFLVTIGAADRDALARAAKERGDLLEAGAKALVNMDPERYTGKGAADRAVGDALVAGAAGILIDLYQQHERDQAQQQRKAAAEISFEKHKDSARLSVARTATRLAARNSWKPGEIGFDDAPFQERAHRRPRDPFVIRDLAAVRVSGETADSLARDAGACVYAATLVPRGHAYDQYRAEMLATAAALSRSAALAAWFEDSSHSYGHSIAKQGVRICRTRLLHDPDQTDIGKYELAICLNVAGEHDEALRTASNAKGQFNSPGFAYDYACFSSLCGRTKQSLEWLEYSFALGMSNIKWYRQDPELAPLRQAYPKEFVDITTVRMVSNLVWGVFNDDYTVTNNSKFTLTQLTVKPIITCKSRKISKPLTASEIRPGATYTWTNAFSVPRDDFVSYDFGEWSCDQQ